MSFVRPYGLVTCRVACSSTGMRSGSPYTVHDDENTRRRTPAASIARSSDTLPATLTEK